MTSPIIMKIKLVIHLNNNAVKSKKNQLKIIIAYCTTYYGNVTGNTRDPTGKRTRSKFKLDKEFEYAIVIG